MVIISLTNFFPCSFSHILHPSLVPFLNLCMVFFLLPSHFSTSVTPSNVVSCTVLRTLLNYGLMFIFFPERTCVVVLYPGRPRVVFRGSGGTGVVFGGFGVVFWGSGGTLKVLRVGYPNQRKIQSDITILSYLDYPPWPYFRHLPYHKIWPYFPTLLVNLEHSLIPWPHYNTFLLSYLDEE